MSLTIREKIFDSQSQPENPWKKAAGIPYSPWLVNYLVKQIFKEKEDQVAAVDYILKKDGSEIFLGKLTSGTLLSQQAKDEKAAKRKEAEAHDAGLVTQMKETFAKAIDEGFPDVDLLDVERAF